MGIRSELTTSFIHNPFDGYKSNLLTSTNEYKDTAHGILTGQALDILPTNPYFTALLTYELNSG
jgi:hypothetical protein